MDNAWKWKSKRLAVVAAILAASAACNIKLFTEQREHVWAEKKEIAAIMTAIQSADSQLQGALLNVENGGGAAGSLYAFGEVRAKLSEAAGGSYEIREFSGQWEEQISQRIKEDPDTEFHKRLAERYGL